MTKKRLKEKTEPVSFRIRTKTKIAFSLVCEELGYDKTETVESLMQAFIDDMGHEFKKLK